VDALSPKPTDEELAYYGNMTGMLRGTWHRILEPSDNPFFPAELPLDGEAATPKVISTVIDGTNASYRDTIVGHSGRFALDMSELEKNSAIQFVESKLSVGSVSGDTLYETRLQGVHFPNTGEAILISATPKKYVSLT
jgi:hypothetical protein